ncbi:MULTISPECIES: type II CAAX endopeptidase family protein [unclassified Rathayibacter]|uniref:CPBP family intramembrane glutamic endopeptidase n=1 Tax=unclassified Rathayibacter TaxID=2609250 RepID=UPI0010461580|nr:MULTISPECIES: type II CAAX endopeptidase family protein [unclassified Rathayibacter]TCL83676.1 membrane protease YdiL (CAAX protease family) [Rathayibacter sp. PhB192]TCM29269.1 membrane protease YdiL (CAAX protease family) [Rathayibacter sp. PhB179]
MTASTDQRPVPRTIPVGIAAAVLYVLIAAGVGTLLDPLAGGDDTLDFVIGTWLPVGVLIVIGLLFARRAGWLREAWTAPSPFTERRRWWLLAIPVVLAVQTVQLLLAVPWAERALPMVLVYLVGCLLIGFGEELYFRGLFRVAVRGHHGELAALLITSIAFGLGHVAGYLLNGVPLPATAVAVAFLAMDGAIFYGALRATGTLWVPILLHGLGDFARFLQQGGDDQSAAPEVSGDAFTALVEYILIGLSIALVVSVARSGRRERKARRAAAVPE